MDDVSRWIGALGFPIVSSMACGYALYRVGCLLVAAFVRWIDSQITQGAKQTAAIEKIAAELPQVCKAQCQEQCENFRPRKAS